MNEFTLVLEPGEVDYIYNVLATRPYQEVAPVMAKIVQQVEEQRSKESEK